MHDPGTLIAVSLLLLYSLLGPVVLLAVYVLFDFLNQQSNKTDTPSINKKDPALWTKKEVETHLSRI